MQALAIGRLANFSEELANSVVQNDIITQLINKKTTMKLQKNTIYL